MNPAEQLAQFATGHWVSQMVYAFAKHGMGDAIGDEGAKASDVAARCGTKPDPTFRLLRGLATIGVVLEDEQEAQRFTLTEMGALLTSGHPTSMVDQVLLEAGYEHVLMWTHLAENLVTGEMAPTKVFGQDNYFGLFDSRPGHLETFSRAMSSYTAAETAMIGVVIPRCRAVQATSAPVLPGSMMSSRIRSKGGPSSRAIASSPVLVEVQA